MLNDNNVSGYFIRCCFVWCGALVGSVSGVSVLCSAVSMVWMFSFFFCGHPWITPGLVVSPYNERGIRTSSGWTCHKLHTLFYMLETIIFELGHENSQFPHLLSLAWFSCSEGCPLYGPYFRTSTDLLHSGTCGYPSDTRPLNNLQKFTNIINLSVSVHLRVRSIDTIPE